MDFNCYVNGKKQSFYNVSDIPFKSEEFVEFIQGTITELIYSGYSVKSLSPMNGGSLDIDRDLTDVLNVHQFETFNTESSVPTVQYSQYCTVGTHTKDKVNKKTQKNLEDDKPTVLYTIRNNTKKPEIETINQKMHPTPLLIDSEISKINNKVRDIFKNNIQKRSFDSVLKKCINNYNKGTVPNYENYLITSIENKIEELEIRRKKENSFIPKTKKRRCRTEIVPEWLSEQKNTETLSLGERSKPQIPSQKTIEDERKQLMEIIKKYKK